MAVVLKLRIAAPTLFSIIAILLLPSIQRTEAQEVGICYGTLGNNLPCATDVVSLYQYLGVTKMRIYDEPLQETLQAVQGSDIKVVLGFNNDYLPSFGSDPSAALDFVQTNVVPFASSIKYIVVGNEVDDDHNASFIKPAMDNMLYALNCVNLEDQIMVSTAIKMSLFKNTFPPSSGEFINPSFFRPIADFLRSNGSPLMLNLFPYFAYNSSMKDIELSYALSSPGARAVKDNGTQLEYYSLFDAEIDSVYAALSKLAIHDSLADSLAKQNPGPGLDTILVVASETGWPSSNKKGGNFASPSFYAQTSVGNMSMEEAANPENAQTYYRNMITRANRRQGTPSKPDEPIDIYMFSLFDENNKCGDPTEQHYGLYTPDEKPKYQLNFCD